MAAQGFERRTVKAAKDYEMRGLDDRAVLRTPLEHFVWVRGRAIAPLGREGATTATAFEAAPTALEIVELQYERLAEIARLAVEAAEHDDADSGHVRRGMERARNEDVAGDV